MNRIARQDYAEKQVMAWAPDDIDREPRATAIQVSQHR